MQLNFLSGKKSNLSNKAVTNGTVYFTDEGQIYFDKNNVRTLMSAHANTSQLSLSQNGKLLYSDPTFKSGTNSVNTYNNTSGSTDLTISRITDSEYCPTGSGNILQIKVSGTATSPGCGGFVQTLTSYANAEFIVQYLIKLPVGYKLNVASNSMGSGYTDTFITSTAGTGKWEWYVRKVKCGSSGSFSNGGHVYVSRTTGNAPSSSSPLTWYLGGIWSYNMAKSEDRFYGTADTANNALKLGGQAPSYYATSEALTSLQGTVNTKVNRAGDTMSGNLSIVRTDANTALVSVKNTKGIVSLRVTTNRGLYDDTTSQWIIYKQQSDNTTRIPTNLYVDGGEVVATKFTGLASKATHDASGNVITTYYAKQADLTSLTTLVSQKYDSTVSRTANTVLAAPNGSSGVATFRALVAADLPVVPASKGGTGQTALSSSANALINALGTGSSTPVDADYYVSQYVGGGTTTTTYHRRPMSALWSYIKSKTDALYPTQTQFTALSGTVNGKLSLSGGTMTGPIKHTSSSLPQSTSLKYIVGIDAFADGGTMKWSAIADVTVGSATKATQDASGNVITSTYATKAALASLDTVVQGKVNRSGDTMTGSLGVKGTITIGDGVTLEFDSTTKCLNFNFI